MHIHHIFHNAKILYTHFSHNQIALKSIQGYSHLKTFRLDNAKWIADLPNNIKRAQSINE